MLSRTLVRPLLAVLLLCGATRPVFADGVFSYDHDKIVAFFTEAFALVAIVLVVVVLLVRWFRAAARREEAKAAEPAFPEARSVKVRNKP
jgi:heme/copper-type cytochrome/quinol oxidase subunit 2